MTAKEFHNAIFKRFNNTDDINIAQDLEILFNYALYGFIDQSQAVDKDYINFLEKAFDSQVRSNILSALSQKFKFNNNNALAKLEAETANQLGDSLEAFIDLIGQSLSGQEISGFYTQQSVTGLDKRIVEIPEELVRKSIEYVGKRNRLSRKKYEGIDNDLRTTSAKQLKTDVDWNKLTLTTSITGQLSPRVQKLLTSTFTAKNYNKFPVHLGDVIQIQAYSGMVRFLENDRFNYKQIIKLFEYYLKEDKENEFLQHMNHIVKIQALVGAGDIAVDATNLKVLGPAALPRFLIVNVRNQNKIYVRSTFAIINQLKKEHSAISKKYKVAVHYKIKNDTDVGTLIAS